MSPPSRPFSILAVSPFLPYPPDHGGRIRTFLLLRELARRGHRVDLVPLLERPEESRHLAALEDHGLAVAPVLHPRRFGTLTWSDRVRKIGHLLRGRSDVLARFGSREALDTIRSLRPEGWDVVLAELLWTAPLALEVSARCRVLNAHNVETLIARRTAETTPGGPRRWAAALEARGLRRDEIRLVKRFHTVIVVSATDRDHMRTLAPSAPLEVIGNCVDTDHLTPLPPPAGPAPVCLFMGSPNYPPNAAAVEHFALRVFPRVRRRFPDAEFVAVGADPPPHLLRLQEDVPGVRMAGYVDDILDAYREATQVVVPLLVGGGTRTKILEALALGRPVVSTTVGAEGLALRNREQVHLADDPEAFARAVIRVHEDPARTARLVSAGRAWVEANGSARAAGAELERVLAATLEREGRS